MKLDKTFVFYADISPYQNKELFKRDLNLVNENRKTKVFSYAKKEDQYRSLAVYILFLKALEMFGLDDSNIRIDENGKPVSDSYYFNFSHSGNYSAIAISNLLVGIDIQKHQSISPLLLEKCFIEEERNKIKDNPNLFFEYWSIKESYLKAIGKGIRLPLDNVQINTEKRLVKAKNEEKPLQYKSFVDIDGYSLVVTGQNLEQVELINIDLNK